MSENGTPPQVIPPGWYADPADPTGKRWWDGRAWTADVQAAEVRPVSTFGSAAPLARVQSAYVPTESGRAFTPATQQTGVAYTRSVWWICAFPLWGLVSQVVIVSILGQLGEVPMLPVALGLTALNLVLWGILIRLAFVDRGGLLAGGNETAASGWWMLLSPLGYLIARALEVKKYEVGAWSPVIWWSIAMVLSPGIGTLGYFAVFGLVGV